jgi:DNA-binding XRE family transcriptional regulator
MAYKVFVSPIKVEADGMTKFGWEKNSRQTWASLLDGRRFDQKNKPVKKRVNLEQERGQKATKKEIAQLLLKLEKKKRQKNWTWLKVAKKIGVNYQTIRNWRENSCNPSQKKIRNISESLEHM